MLYNEKYGTFPIDGTTMEYIRFGKGKRVLILIPGLGDSLRSMKGTALPMAVFYRQFCKEFTVYVFARKHVLQPGSTIRDMARDLAYVMERMGIPCADILGVSMGGMIAQHLALDYPEKVNKLVLTVTAARPNPVLTEAIAEWVSYVRQDDFTGFMQSNLKRIYSKDYCRKNQWMVPVLGKFAKPKSFDRFFIQADACLIHDTYDKLPGIQSQTLVIGGEQDLSLGGEASREIAEKIPGAKLLMYEEWGHGLYEEAKDYNQRVLDFLLS